MSSHRSLTRPTLWLFALALVLKSAVPMLASASAALQGKGVAEVCPIYGVALPGRVAAAASPAGHAGNAHAMHAMHAMHSMAEAPVAPAADTDTAPPSHGAGAHSGDHCILTALAALATGAGEGALPHPTHGASARPLALGRAEARVADASARWATLLGHGPPHLS